MAEMQCFACGRDVSKHTLFRINEKGVTGVWACRDHVPDDMKVDPVVREIADIIDPPVV